MRPEERLRQVVRVIAETAVDNETELSDLDAVVGDGDFGHSLARGFEAVIDRLDTLADADRRRLLMAVAQTIMGHTGGTSGPIWGTIFLRASKVAASRPDLDANTVVAMLRAAVDGIKERGQSVVGDKTLLDALVPAVDELDAQLRDGAEAAAAVAAAARVARDSAEATRLLQARKGRASYAGQRSIGSLDAGAVAVATMFERVAAGWS